MKFYTFTTSYGVMRIFAKTSLAYEPLIRDLIESDEVKEEYENYLNHLKQGFIKENGADKK